VLQLLLHLGPLGLSLVQTTPQLFALPVQAVQLLQQSPLLGLQGLSGNGRQEALRPEELGICDPLNPPLILCVCGQQRPHKRTDGVRQADVHPVWSRSGLASLQTQHPWLALAAAPPHPSLLSSHTKSPLKEDSGK
jgi:hypothetical protein